MTHFPVTTTPLGSFNLAYEIVMTVGTSPGPFRLTRTTGNAGTTIIDGLLERGEAASIGVTKTKTD